MGNSPQNQDHDDKKIPSQDQRSEGLKQTPQTKSDDKATNVLPLRDGSNRIGRLR